MNTSHASTYMLVVAIIAAALPGLATLVLR
jgi:hypothetical protein